MVPLSHAAAFAVAAFIIIVIPGPNVLFAIGRALTLGRRPAILSVLGAVAGSTVPLIAVAVGLGAILMTSTILFTIVKTIGVLYLIYLGVTAIRDRKKLAAALHAAVPAVSGRRVFGQGFVVGATNPKTVVFFGAVLPQFAVPEAGSLPVQLLILGGIFLAIQTLSDGTWAIVAAGARGWFARSPRRVEAVGSAGGMMIIGLGTSVAFASAK
ncbi:LysE family translocator [Nocardia mangyaensis]|uniref:LysE family translocator n=1 Tax=Nocardia mangyaensis TaxID=2213200 RepID=UPI00267460A2|nr:LysE family translocator [Nocardia mangyaensis]MDO3649696.1 LysE family translocator [Nocardia mangyaensis]